MAEKEARLTTEDLDHVKKEASRLIHNYSCSFSSLVDHSRIIKRRFCESSDAQIKTLSNEYQARVDTVLKDNFYNSFVKNLRNYLQHIKIPNIESVADIRELKMLENQHVSLEYRVSLVLYREDIINSSNNWSSIVKDYFNSHEKVYVFEAIVEHFHLTKEFYLWLQFREEQLYTSDPETAKLTFEDWQQTHEYWQS